MQLNDDDRVRPTAPAEIELDKKEENEEIFHGKQDLNSSQDAQTGQPIRPQGRSVAEACSVLHVEADDRPRTKSGPVSASS